MDSRESFHSGHGTTSVKGRDGEEGQRGGYGKNMGKKWYHLDQSRSNGQRRKATAIYFEGQNCWIRKMENKAIGGHI